MNEVNAQEQVIAGLEDYSLDQISIIVNNFIKENTEWTDHYFHVKRIAIVGSRVTGNHANDSDLDIAFEYNGRYKHEIMMDYLNSEPLEIEGIRVDFIPYARYAGEFMNEFFPLVELNK